MTQQIPAHSAALSRWPSIASPISAATAGCRLIHTPNTRGGTRRSASNSSQYGITDDSSPIAAPVSSSDGRNIRGAPAATPGPVTSTAATHIAITSPADPGTRCPVALLNRM